MRDWGIMFLVVGLIALILGAQLAVLAIVAGVVMILVAR